MQRVKKLDNRIIPINNDVSWIGVLDYDIVTFDVVMQTQYGTTYNSYFINADMPTIIETTKETFWQTYLHKIKQVVEPEKIKYIVLDHTEPDHSGNLMNLLKLAPEAKVVGSATAIRNLKDLFNVDFPNIIVKGGDKLDLGNKTLEFISAPNLHWPDSIFTYLQEDKLLFTCDSFGCHYADDRMIDKEVDNFDDAFKYYFDVILKPYSKFMLQAIDRIKDLEIKAILTGHGPLLLNNWKRYVDWSIELSKEFLATKKYQDILIAYVSAYGKTEKLAEAIAEGAREEGLEVILKNIEHSSLGELDEYLTRAKGIAIGSPVINQNILLPIYKLFGTVNPIRDRGKFLIPFGSYGWSGENQKMIPNIAVGLKLNVMDEGIFTKFTPSDQDIIKAKELGKKLAQLVKENSVDE
jgi:flavorubredoxin